MRWRRVAYRGGAGLIVLGLALTAGSPVGSQTPAFTNGTANATAIGIKVNPTAAALSLGITFGTALSQYTNEVAKAESRGIDFGIIGTTLAAEGCDPEDPDPTWPAEDQPQPLSADSRQADAAAGKTGPDTMFGSPIPGFEKSVKATPQPLGEAVARVAPLGQPGISVDGVRTSSLSRVVDGKTREAVAITEIKSLDLGGQVRLAGLKWESIHRTGADQTQTGTFSIGSASIAGSLVPLPTNDPAALFDALNTALAPLGLRLGAPGTRVVNGAVTVDPLTIGVVPSSTRDQVAGTVLAAALPARQAIVDALLAMDCGNDAYVTVADIAVGSLTGAGSLSLELGGVQAYSGELQLSSFFQDIGGGLDAGPIFLGEETLTTGGELTTIEGTPGIPGTPAIPGGATSAQKGSSGTRNKELASPVLSTKGERGGKLALLAGGTLLLLAAVAELDRRKMRAALNATAATAQGD